VRPSALAGDGGYAGYGSHSHWFGASACTSAVFVAGPNRMKIRDRLLARRRRKAHEHYLDERERQERLQRQDVEKAVREVTTWAGGNQQGGH
jgi:hypothetical protein